MEAPEATGTRLGCQCVAESHDGPWRAVADTLCLPALFKKILDWVEKVEVEIYHQRVRLTDAMTTDGGHRW
jgi:hypothetical protein